MNICAGRVAVVTGAGGGIGRHHALELARQGARVVVNDFGPSGTSPAAEAVVAEIEALGGTAVAHRCDVSDMASAAALVERAVEEFGGLDVLVNNAGILRDRMLTTMSEDDWDAVIRVHLKGTFAPTQAAARYFRACHREGRPRSGRIINTSSSSGLRGNVGQSNYGAAKAGVAAFTQIAAMELHRYGVTVNAVSPAARTQMTEGLMSPPEGDFDVFDPAAISPLVAWLSSAEAGWVTGHVFDAHGGVVGVYEGWDVGPARDRGRLWRAEEMGEAVRDLLSRATVNPRLPRPEGAPDTGAGTGRHGP
ncbi:SDR family oxidoreductase [Streptosporangium sp. NPDC051022]|uniref:SDR family oxidoreductase n=1 Tax=Streptosporangium sp. NPDC051022 TaxID=3155752 RepID=UPI0034272492